MDSEPWSKFAGWILVIKWQIGTGQPMVVLIPMNGKKIQIQFKNRLIMIILEY